MGELSPKLKWNQPRDLLDIWSKIVRCQTVTENAAYFEFALAGVKPAFPLG